MMDFVQLVQETLLLESADQAYIKDYPTVGRIENLNYERENAFTFLFTLSELH